MAYSEKVIDHYNDPRNVGSLEKNDSCSEKAARNVSAI